MAEHRTAGLRVVTWNVGEVYWPWQANELKDIDVGVVRDELAALDPDVVLVQELQHDGQLSTLCGDRYRGAMARACGYDRHVGLLVRRSLAPTFHDHLLEPTKRGCVEARFRVEGEEVSALSLHLDVFARRRRLRQVHAVAALLRSQTPPLTVAGGDFNYDPAVSARLGYEDDARAEAALREHLADAAEDSGPTLVGLLRVDRVLAGGALYRGARSFTSATRTPLGDHAPLVCDIALAHFE